MSTRITECFDALRQKGEAALIAYFTAGDPDLESVPELICALEDAGADIIEVGVPFSDPMADGPTIQAASERALKHRIKVGDILERISKTRKRSSVPIVLFGYYNPFFRYGAERLAKDARTAGVDGLLVVDLPPEEAVELKPYTDKENLDLIFLIAPNTPDKRLKQIAKISRGFVYCVSVTGVTGARANLKEHIGDYLGRVKRHIKIPAVVGFGVSTPEHAAQIAAIADGAVVGSALINEMVNHPSDPINSAAKFTRSLKQAMKNGVHKVRARRR